MVAIAIAESFVEAWPLLPHPVCCPHCAHPALRMTSASAPRVRVVVADLVRVRHWADALIKLHLDPAAWSFGFDNAKTRAGLCNFTREAHHRVPLPRRPVRRRRDPPDPAARGRPCPRRAARRARAAVEADRRRTRLRGQAHCTTAQIADELAPWVGTCPAGHVHYRYRKPTQAAVVREVLAPIRCRERHPLGEPPRCVALRRMRDFQHPEPSGLAAPSLRSPSRVRPRHSSSGRPSCDARHGRPTVRGGSRWSCRRRPP